MILERVRKKIRGEKYLQSVLVTNTWDLIKDKRLFYLGFFKMFGFFVSGVFGKGKCGCPCRDYYLPKCEIEYQQQCYYEHYEQVLHNYI